MTTENNFDDKLREISDKINKIESVQEIDILAIKTAVESIKKELSQGGGKNAGEINNQSAKSAEIAENNSTLVKDIYEDISNLRKDVTQTVKTAEEIRDNQKKSITSGDFEEFQKQQLDLVLKTNENISGIKNIAEKFKASDGESLNALKEKIDELHNNLSAYIEKILSKSNTYPTIAEIGTVISDAGEIQQRSINRTAETVKEIQESLNELKSEMKNKDLEKELKKISEIYDNLNKINLWTEKVGYINQAVENVYARLGENADFDDIAEKIDILYENITALNTWTMKIDNLETISSATDKRIAALANFNEESKKIIDTIENVKSKLEQMYSHQPDFAEISDKTDILYENITALNTWMMKIDNLEKISSETDKKITALADFREESKKITDTIENVKAKLEQMYSHQPDFAEISDKTDILYENITALNTWMMKIDSVYDKLSQIEKQSNKEEAVNENIILLRNDSKEYYSTINDKLELIQEFVQSDAVIKQLNNIAAQTESLINNSDSEKGPDIDGLNYKIALLNDDINNLALKFADSIGSIDSVNAKFTEVASQMTSVSQDIGEFTDGFDSAMEKIENVNTRMISVSDEVNNVASQMTSVNEEIGKISSQITAASEEFEDNMIYSKIDLIYENIGLLNSWVTKIDKIAEKSEESIVKYNQAKEDYDSKIKEITRGLDRISEITEDVPGIKDKLDMLAEEINTVTHKTKDDTETYIYTLLDIESDFIKIHKALEENNKTSSEDINKLKEDIRELKSSFSDITNDISSISIRTNKLILTADDANKEFEKCVDRFKDALSVLESPNGILNRDEKLEILNDKLSGMSALLQRNITGTGCINDAFVYLAQWIDNAGVLLNGYETELNEIKKSCSSTEETDAIKAAIFDLQKRAGENSGKIELLLKTLTDLKKSTDDSEDEDKIASNLSKVADGMKITLKQNQAALNEMAALKKSIKEEVVSRISEFSEKLNEREEDLLKPEDISEIKSMMSGITVQLGTSLIPEIDGFEQKIEKIFEEQESRFAKTEEALNEKIISQQKQIASLEQKLDNLNSKFDKLTESVSEDNKDGEIKDILNYIVTQINTSTEAFNEKADMIQALSDKVAGFDESINKVVSYIEED